MKTLVLHATGSLWRLARNRGNAADRSRKREDRFRVSDDAMLDDNIALFTRLGFRGTMVEMTRELG
jgi:hypothetical protein